MRAEEHQRLLVDGAELTWVYENMLTVVISLATQTLLARQRRHCEDIFRACS